MSENRYLTPAIIAARWDCSAAHVRRLCASGELIALKIGERGWRITTEALAAYEATHTNAAATAASVAPRELPQIPLSAVYSSVTPTPIFKGVVPWRVEVVQ